MMKKKNFITRLLAPFQGEGDVKEKKREFFFNEFYIAGYRYYDGDRVEEALMEGTIVSFKREPGCVHDARAVEIYAGGKKLGYIPRKDNAAVSRLMDQGVTIKGKIQKRNFDDDPGKRIKICVFKELE